MNISAKLKVSVSKSATSPSCKTLAVSVKNDTNNSKTKKNMGLFDFLKPKKTELDDNLSQLLKAFFPKGETDINAGTNELLLILNNSINKNEARNIFVKSVSMSRVASNFDKERLVKHLSGYCLQHFNEQQLDKFFNYLTALTVAMKVHGSSPVEIKRDGDAYVW